MASSTSNSLSPLFTAGGLASGLDTTSIVDQLTALQSQPITALQNQEAATKTQVSLLGDLAARLSSLKDATDALSSTGALAMKVTSTNSAFSATASPNAQAGSFQIQVDQLAVAAQARSQAFASATAAVTGGTLALSVQGVTTNVTISDGEALSDVAFDINHSGAAVSATVLNDGTHAYLSITGRGTGFPIGGTADQALSITETSTGTLGQALSAAIVTTAKNASFSVDGLPFTRTSNSFNDAVPGVNISLAGKSANGPETLTLDTDATATQASIQKFVDAYNSVMKQVQAQFAISGATDTTSMLSHDPVIRTLQTDLQGLLSTTVGTGAIRSLADLGIETERDGSLTIDASKLSNAISANPSAVNELFQNATAGIGKVVDDLAQRYTDPTNGILTLDSKGLQDNMGQMDDHIAALQLRVSKYHDNLVAQFTAMETIVSQMKSVASFLTAQDAKKS